MLKCGQKNNTNYTFGLTEKQIKEGSQKAQEPIIICACSHCGQTSMVKTKFCSNCGGTM